MAQGVIKTRKPPPSSRKPSTAGPKKGQRAIAPKKRNLVAQKKITKKYTAGLTGKTERALAERAGHLEMLGGGKKKKKREERKGGGAGDGEGIEGGKGKGGK
ncbi:hypothetical protein HO173_008536 [Letharia columbiana]|uniref:Uncharacterized protein n=1 Tax=Letharia columbiana TaxID=112416 RepID=A0A8H6L2M2_9LECA|nr:uncharacterized protein HO173_008536 [Letharia columbiana]KAF6233247.1 hypothetical protein HO173_008536 [Letharia columbiana]